MAGKVGRPRKEERVKRVPFGGHTSNLQVEDEVKGHRLYWFNDDGGRVERAKRAGYVNVEPQEVPLFMAGKAGVGSEVSVVVTRGNKKPMRGVLMKIPNEFYKEDLIAKEAVNAQVDEALRQGTPGGNVVDNQYVPKGHVQQI